MTCLSADASTLLAKPQLRKRGWPLSQNEWGSQGSGDKAGGESKCL